MNEWMNYYFFLVSWTHKAQNDLNNVQYVNGTNQGLNCGGTFEGKVVVRLCVGERVKLKDIWKECDSIRQTELWQVSERDRTPIQKYRHMNW